jgi:hypothetical protein
MSGTVVVTARDDAATVIVVALSQHGRRWEVGRVTRVESGRLTLDPELYGPGVPDRASDCVEPAACVIPEQLRSADAPLPISRSGGATTLSFLIAAAHADVTIEPGAGWVARRVTGGGLHLVDNRTAGGSGAKFNRVSVEHFTGASLPVSAGSVAFAAIPCPPDPYLLGEPGGTGEAVLTGGDSGRGGQVMRCRDRTWVSYDVASGPTRWEVRGDVTGRTAQVVRLAVLVLPPPSS